MDEPVPAKGTAGVGVAVGLGVAGAAVGVGVRVAPGGGVGVTVGGETVGVTVGGGTVAVGVGVLVGLALITVKGTEIWQAQAKSVKNTGHVPPPGTYGTVNVKVASPFASVVPVATMGSPGIWKITVSATPGFAPESSAVTTVPGGPELGVSVTTFPGFCA